MPPTPLQVGRKPPKPKKTPMAPGKKILKNQRSKKTGNPERHLFGRGSSIRWWKNYLPSEWGFWLLQGQSFFVFFTKFSGNCVLQISRPSDEIDESLFQHTERTKKQVFIPKNFFADSANFIFLVKNVEIRKKLIHCYEFLKSAKCHRMNHRVWQGVIRGLYIQSCNW